MYDVIPDIHGQADKLKSALNDLGYRERNGAWRHSNPTRRVVYLGDFIDRGPDNREVLRIVRGMLDAGTASAVMGNHELNAIQFHTLHPETGKPLRARTEKNGGQHKTFLDEFQMGATQTNEQIRWMKTLPLFIDFSDFRVVHACWDRRKIQRLKELTYDNALTDEQFVQVADKTHELYGLVETTTKGPEILLSDGITFVDKDGHERAEIRVQWWNANAKSWADIAMSVPDKGQLPVSPLPQNAIESIYAPDEVPVFFGHYWLSGEPVLQARNALCLDYSAGKNGPLVSYGAEPGKSVLSLDCLRIHR